MTRMRKVALLLGIGAAVFTYGYWVVEHTIVVWAGIFLCAWASVLFQRESWLGRQYQQPLLTKGERLTPDERETLREVEQVLLGLADERWPHLQPGRYRRLADELRELGT